jgi:hypothetical protein
MPILENGSINPSKPLSLDEYLCITRLTPEQNTYSVNKHILKVLGPLYAIYLTNLMELQREKAEHEEDYGDFFKSNHKEQIEATGLNDYEIRKSKNFFKKIGILSTTKKGIPAKEYYKINYRIAEYLFCIDNNYIEPKEGKKPEVIKLKKLIGRKK